MRGIENVMKKVLGNVRLWWKFRKMNLERRKRNLERRRDNAGRTGGRREFEGGKREGMIEISNQENEVGSTER